MKKYLAIFTAALMLTSATPAPAQETQTAPDASAAPNVQPSQDSTPPPDAAPMQDNQQSGPAPEQQAAEQPGVARVSMIRGDVSSQRGDSGDWVAVSLNTPVSVGDRVSTGNNSRVELQLDFADVLRLGENAAAQIANINRSQVQVQVGQGLATYTVLRGAEASSEIDTPNAAIHPLGEGDYRVLVTSDSVSQVIVRRGSADISTPQGSTRVSSGQMITIEGSSNPQYRVDVAPGSDEWDSWNSDRDGIITSAESVQRTNRYYTGAQDLDAYGHWTQAPDYGNVWVPAQNADWAPYRDGRWVWEPYYGYTWVSNEPWGWAPYHYGRWFMYDNNWAWWPGPLNSSPAYDPVWSPAYVSFFGFGAGLGYGIASAFGNMFGWLACGPGDWFHPWYGGWGGRFGSSSFGNNFARNGWAPLGRDGGRRFSNLDGARTNARIRGGLSTMRANDFGRGAVPRHQEAMSAAAFRQGRAISGGVPVTPTRASLNPTGRAAGRSTMHGGGASQHFFAKSQPAKVTPFRDQASRVDRAIQSSHAGAARDSQASRQTAATNQQARAATNSTANLHNNVAPRTQAPTAANRGYSSGAAQASRLASGTATNRSSIAGNSQSSARPGWRSFTPPAASTSRAGERTPSASAETPGNRGSAAPRSFTPPASRSGQASSFAGGSTQPAARGGFQPFTPQSRESQPSRSFAPAASTSRSGYSATRGSRPALNLNQPIVRPRNSSAGGNGASRGGASRTTNAPRMNYGPPSGGERGMPPSSPSRHSESSGSGGSSHHSSGSAYAGGGHSSHSSGSHGGGGGSHHSGGGGHSSSHSSGHSGGHSGGGHHKH
jgi:hypothetical protein